MPYYDLHPFSETQAHHAAERVLFLMRTKRFFLHNPKEFDLYHQEDYTLHPKVFADAIALNADHLQAHRDARQQAIEEIQQFEADHQITAPKVPRNCRVVDFSRYSGGFEICRVYPLAAFAAYVPRTFDDLVAQLFERALDGQTVDDIAPKMCRTYKENAAKLASTIWEQLQAIDASNPDNNRCLVLLQSRITMSDSDSKGDFANGRLWDLQDFPFAVGYLLHQYSKERRIVQHNYIICSTFRQSHVSFEHWAASSDSVEPPRIRYFKTGGYTNRVMFACVL